MVKNFKSSLVLLSLVIVAFMCFVVALGIDVVNVVSPANNSWTSGTNDSITFTFNYTGENATASCELFVNDTGVGINSSVLNNTNTTIYSNATINDGANEWFVNCTNGTTINSTVWTLNVDTTYPQIDTAYPTNTSYATAPTQFNYTYTETNCDKAWYSNDSGTTNSSAVSCGTNFTSMVTVETSNTWIVYMNDSAGNENSSSITFTVDTTAPTTTITSTASGFTSTSPIPMTVTFSEAVTDFVVGDITVGNGAASSFTGSGTTYTFDVTPSADGSVTVDVAANVANDSVGNNNTVATQFSITYTASSSGSSSGSTPTYRPSMLRLTEGYKIALAKNYKVNFEASGESHVLNIDDISGDVVTITISSDPITLEINSGETRKVDLNSDGYYDLSILLEEIKASKANIVLTSINEEVVGDGVVSEPETSDQDAESQEDAVEDAEVEDERSYVIWIVLAIILVIVGAIVAGMKLKEDNETVKK